MAIRTQLETLCQSGEEQLSAVKGAVLAAVKYGPSTPASRLGLFSHIGVVPGRRDAVELDVRIALATFYETLLRVKTGSLERGRGLRIPLLGAGSRRPPAAAIRARKRRVRPQRPSLAHAFSRPRHTRLTPCVRFFSCVQSNFLDSDDEAGAADSDEAEADGMSTAGEGEGEDEDGDAAAAVKDEEDEEEESEKSASSSPSPEPVAAAEQAAPAPTGLKLRLTARPAAPTATATATAARGSRHGDDEHVDVDVDDSSTAEAAVDGGRQAGDAAAAMDVDAPSSAPPPPPAARVSPEDLSKVRSRLCAAASA